MTETEQKECGLLLHAQAHAIACVNRINDLLQDRLKIESVRDFHAELDRAVTNAENATAALKKAMSAAG